MQQLWAYFRVDWIHCRFTVGLNITHFDRMQSVLDWFSTSLHRWHLAWLVEELSTHFVNPHGKSGSKFADALPAMKKDSSACAVNWKPHLKCVEVHIPEVAAVNGMMVKCQTMSNLGFLLSRG